MAWGFQHFRRLGFKGSSAEGSGVNVWISGAFGRVALGCAKFSCTVDLWSLFLGAGIWGNLGFGFRVPKKLGDVVEQLLGFRVYALPPSHLPPPPKKNSKHNAPKTSCNSWKMFLVSK